MRRHKYVLSALLATLILAAAVGTASASHLSTSHAGMSIIWTSLHFNSSAGTTISCPVTLEGTLHSTTFAKTRGSLIGFITRATVARPCTGGTAWANNGSERNEVLGTTLGNSLPWHITYEGFTGTLPNITEVHLLLTRVRFLLRATILGISLLCSYTNTIERPAEGWLILGRGGAVSSLRPNERINIPSESGGGCPEGNFSNAGTVRDWLGNNLTITLI